MKHVAQGLAALGRGEDKMLVHMTPREVAGLQELALAHGGSLTINPKTGLPEAGFLSNILPTLAGAAAIYFTGGAGLAGLGAGGTGALAGAATGALMNRNNPLQGALMGGLGGYGGAGVMSGLQGMGAAAPSAFEGNVAASLPSAAPTAASATPAAMPSITAPTAPTNFELLSRGAQSAVSNPGQFASALGQQFPGTMGKTAAGIGALNTVGAFDQPGLKLPATTGAPSTARLSGPVKRPYDPNAPEGYYFTDRGIIQPAYAGGGGVQGEAGIASFKKGQFLDGPGDGMSDSIPATIGDKQPALLSDSEFVVPADVVSHLGNGSSKAGAKRLYQMMDRVRHARTGRKKQSPQINADKLLPA